MQNKKLKILEICPFSAGIGGVWTRVEQEAREFKKLGHEITILSSDREEGTNKIAKSEDVISGIKISRLSSNQGYLDRLILSKNVTYFEPGKSIKEIKPDVVITHLLHPHSFKALKMCQKLNIPCYLVTHAPFNVKRNFLLNIAKKGFDRKTVKPNINEFTKIITITKWEEPYLRELGADENNFVYIPNGLPEEFFVLKKIKPTKQILFLGRIAPVKNLEVLISAAKKLPEIEFSIVGMAESDYLKKLQKSIAKSKNVRILPPIYDLKQKIGLIDKHRIFVLPSKREAMPQVLLEAMSRGKLVISSKTDGGKEIIWDNQNGFLFSDTSDLIRLIKENKSGNKKIQDLARKDSKQYRWSNLIKSYLKIFKK
jgi:glycosyltransferase involved in cell wall biosynthesis